MSTPDYTLKEQFVWEEGPETRTLDPGTFVRPVEIQYVPKHVQEDSRWKGFRADRDIFCWCSKGFLMIPRDKIRKA